jgi:hypothetical protein
VSGRRGCVVDGCDRKHYSRGYCQADYYVARREGWIEPLEPGRHEVAGPRAEAAEKVAERRRGKERKPAECNVPSRWTGRPCGRPAARGGQCSVHLAIYSELTRVPR